MKTKSILITLLWITVGVSLSSFVEPAGTEKFIVDSKSSSLLWTGKKVTGEHHGAVQIASGELLLTGKLVTQGSFEIDLTTLTVNDITDKASNEKLVNHLKSDDFFGATKFPKANFVLSSISKKSGNEFDVKGKLTIKGITNDIEFPAVIIQEGKKLTANAKITVDRTKFGIKFKSPNFFENLGDKAIYDNFELALKLVAIAKPGV